MLALVWVAHPSIAIGSPVATSAKSSPPATAPVQTPSEWHRQRRKAILEAHRAGDLMDLLREVGLKAGERLRVKRALG